MVVPLEVLLIYVALFVILFYYGNFPQPSSLSDNRKELKYRLTTPVSGAKVSHSKKFLCMLGKIT